MSECCSNGITFVVLLRTFAVFQILIMSKVLITLEMSAWFTSTSVELVPLKPEACCGTAGEWHTVHCEAKVLAADEAYLSSVAATQLLLSCISACDYTPLCSGRGCATSAVCMSLTTDSWIVSSPHQYVYVVGLK